MKSDAGLEDVYNSKWPFYELLGFTKNRKTADRATTTMKHKAPPINQKQKKEEDFISPSEEAKIKVFEAIANCLSERQPTSQDSHATW